MSGTEHQLFKTEDDMYDEEFDVVYREEKQVSLGKSGEKNARIVVKEEEDSETEFDILESVYQSVAGNGKWWAVLKLFTLLIRYFSNQQDLKSKRRRRSRQLKHQLIRAPKCFICL